MISDRATFAYVADVFILPAHRGRGVAKQLMARIKSHPDLQGLRRWSLGTRDAHGLYRQFGFREPADPSLWMEIYAPDVRAASRVDGPPAHRGNDRDLHAVRHGRAQAAGVADAVRAHEHVDVPSHGALFGQNAVAQARVESPDLFQRLTDGREGRLDRHASQPLRVRGQRPGQGDGDAHQATRRPRAFSTVAAFTQTTGGRPSAISFHDEPPSAEPNSLPLRVPK